MRRVLIISPHFPPVNAPDHQRVRISLPYLNKFGWEATLLAVKPDFVEGATWDPLLEKTIPNEIEVIRVGALSPKLTRYVGLGSLATRALPYLWKEGNRILSADCPPRRVNCLPTADCGPPTTDNGRQVSKKFDLVYFSTTQFPVMIVGPIWKRRFNIPYVTDFQDPWLDDYYSRTKTPPPGGQMKYGASHFLASRLEPRVMRDVSQVICVSPAYAETLQRRYPHLRQDQFRVLPFGAPEKDFELLPGLNVEQKIFDRSDGKQHWAYFGAAGSIMETAVRFLFSGLARLRQKEPETWRNIQLHFVGTSYAPSEHAIKTIQPIAQEFGLTDIVKEITDRQPYFETLKALTEADALMIIGSDSPGYSASKLYPYMLARKPMLAVLHEESPAAAILRECGAGNVITFSPENAKSSTAEMARALHHTYDMATQRVLPELNARGFAKYSAREMTRKMCEVFDRVLEQT